MKKKSIFNHEINESVQAHAAMNCLRNRNNRTVILKESPDYSEIGHNLADKIRDKVKRMDARDAELFIAKEICNKLNKDWRRIKESEKDEMMQSAWDVYCYIKRTKEEQEETKIMTPVEKFDARFKYNKRIKEMANAITKEAYMIIRDKYGDGMWRALYMDDCDEFGLVSQINDYQKYYGITNPQDIVDCLFGKKSVKSFKKSNEEQEETKLSESQIEELAFRLADYLIESFIVLEDEDEDYSNLLEAVEKILKKDAPKSNNIAGYYAWCKKWYQKIEDLTYSYNNEPNPLSYYTDEEEEEYDTTYSLNAYYSQDEPDYENDHHGIWLIINLMRKKGMLRAQGIEGRDDVDDGAAIMSAYDLIEQKLDDEGMWIGDDDHEAERFVSFFGDEIAEEAMKSALHNQKVDDMEGSRKEYYSQDEPDYDDDSHGIRLIMNLLMKRGDITKNDVPRVQKQIKSMLDAEGMWIGDDESEAKRFIEQIWDNQEEEEMPRMEEHDIILALAEDLAESWIDTGDDGDLDDIYYAVEAVLRKTREYPESTKWEDCKPWCQKYYKEIEDIIYAEEEEETKWDEEYLSICIDDLYEKLMENGDGYILDETPSKKVKEVIKNLLVTKTSPDLEHDDDTLAWWVKKHNKEIVAILEQK